MLYTQQQIHEWKTKAEAGNYWNFFNQLLEIIYKKQDFNQIIVHLNGGRKSGKTFRTMEFIAKASILAKNECDSYLFRLMLNDSSELFSEIQDHFNNLLKRELTPKEINHTSKTIKINNNFIRTLGVHKPLKRKSYKLVGLKRAKNKKYAIIVLEECYEFNDQELSFIFESIGGYKNYIIFYISNPNTLNTPYLKRIHNIFPHDEKILKEQGYQSLMRNNELIFYNNWRVNPFITKADITTLANAWQIDPERAKVIDWGIPGVEAGRIYTYELPYINVFDSLTHTPQPKSISIGIDWGDGNNEASSATTLIIGGLGSNQQRIIYKEYYQHNKNGYKSVYTKAEEIINIIKHFFNSYHFEKFKATGINCFLDTGLFSEMEILKTEALKQNLYYLNFLFATKYQERTRINIRKFIMMNNCYYVHRECVNLLRELEEQEWDPDKKDKQNMPKQQDYNNHTTDAEDYTFCQSTYEITQLEQYKFIHKE